MALRGENDDGLVITSDPTTFTVVETIFSGDSLGEPEPATPSILKQILDGEATRVSNEQARVTAESARVSAEATRQSQFTTAITNANTATENANDAAALARVNVPYNEITGAIASMTDADNGAVMEELTVYGKTVQNLWVNPSGTNQGITATSNDDGSITLSGTNSTENDLYLYSDVIDAIPYGKQITFSASNYGVTGEWRFVLSGIGGATPDSQKTFTAVKGENNSGKVAVVITPGTTVNVTVRVMLNEGPTAQPWCPPGLSSVGELSVVSAGKNLLRFRDNMNAKTSSGLTFTPNSDGTVTVNGTSTINNNDFYLVGKSYQRHDDSYLPTTDLVFSTNGRANLYAWDASGRVVLGIGAVNNKVVIPADDVKKFAEFVVYLSYHEGQGESNKRVYVQLELGSTATAYKPPAVTTVPVDLSRYQLRSLPDGICDALSVDGSGSVELEKACAEIVLDGSSDEVFQTSASSGVRYFTYSLTPPASGNYVGIYCDTLPATSGTGIVPRVYIASNGSAVYFFGILNVDDVESFRTWLSQHPTTVIYPVAAPQTIHLPPVTPPILRSPIFNVWAATDVPTTIDLSYGWDASGMLNQATPSLCREGIRNLFM